MLDQLYHIIRSSQILLPDILLVGVFLVIVLGLTLSSQLDSERIHNVFNALIISVLISLVFVFYAFLGFFGQFFESGSVLYNGLIYLDNYAIFFKILISIAAALVLLQVWVIGYRVVGEFYAILVATVFGLYVMVMTTHLMTVYIAIETVSISSYILVAINKSKLNAEAGIKYLLFGAVSSAIMLYGISWIYGLTGTLNFASQEFTFYLWQNPTWVSYLAVTLTISGLLFKLSASPFHIWTPDVYQAAPTPIVAFFSIAPKAAALLILIRIFKYLSIDYQTLLTVIILVSLTIGNLSALWQTNTKRMLAYSSIAHAGFMLIGLLATSQFGIQTAIFYTTAYLFITIAAFVLIDLLALKTESYEMESLRGLGQENIILGFSAVVVMMALVGLPPTVGFTGKLLIFSALWEHYQTTSHKLSMVVLIFGLLNSAIAIFYYMKIPYFMIFKEAKIGTRFYDIGWLRKIFLLTFVAIIIYLFFKPDWLVDLIGKLSSI